MNARTIKMVDQYTRECVALEVGRHFRGQDVATILMRIAFTRGLPTTINVDNGTEFTSRAFDHWAYTNHVQLDFSRPRKADRQRDDRIVQHQCATRVLIATLLFDSRRGPSRPAGVLGRSQQPSTA